jgi:hypothetical protein
MVGLEGLLDPFTSDALRLGAGAEGVDLGLRADELGPELGLLARAAVVVDQVRPEGDADHR